jgi:hypothetical protein
MPFRITGAAVTTRPTLALVRVLRRELVPVQAMGATGVAAALLGVAVG